MYCGRNSHFVLLFFNAQVYIVYLILISVQIFNKIASVLLYALMCCIYATLFAVVIFFCPRLINLMRPSLETHRGLAVRLIVATSVCILIFGIHCINYARLVIAPPRKVYWWYQYGSYRTAGTFFFCVFDFPNSDSFMNLPFPPSKTCRLFGTDPSHNIFVHNASISKSCRSIVQPITRLTSSPFKSIGVRSAHITCRFQPPCCRIRWYIEQQQ
jgi:hypothetical protein